MTFEQAIKNAIKGKGITLIEAAKKLNISRNTLYTHMGSATIDPEFAENVRTILDIDLYKLLEEIKGKEVVPVTNTDKNRVIDDLKSGVNKIASLFMKGVLDSDLKTLDDKDTASLNEWIKSSDDLIKRIEERTKKQ